MKRSSGTPALSHLVLSWMAAFGTAAWALAGTADTPKESGTRPLAASGPHSDGADAVLQTRQRSAAASKTSRNDKHFLTRAAAAGRAEVEMGRLGQQRAQSSEVKSFAERIVQDHARVNSELQALGSARGLSWPYEGGPAAGTTSMGTGSTGASAAAGSAMASGMASGPRPSAGTGMGMGTGMGSSGAMDASPMKLSAAARHSMERLQGLSGADFDREFMKQMVTDHKTAVADFQRAAASASDPELKTFAQRTLPGLQEHLQMARSLGERMASSGRR
ncbi:DUF4142 domain-containing protein [Mitsuaria sp. WAJ17]|uniref:DUF4142 domain-containing protein n=1 Tax=Mitsuaria sp. WAJ17 TaxID=2761452 RepID=UPI00160112DA|nr:DUF4142 domain-containing protein [Mitsuaria sp. WAJ17]MBB2487656.1 DUF4142 domain-containing protein [Mitsuaria sp. WAJ17]